MRLGRARRPTNPRLLASAQHDRLGGPPAWQAELLGALNGTAKRAGLLLPASVYSRVQPHAAWPSVTPTIASAGTLRGAPSPKSTRASRGSFAYQPSSVPSEPMGVAAVACTSRTRSPGLRLVARVVLSRFAEWQDHSGGTRRADRLERPRDTGGAPRELTVLRGSIHRVRAAAPRPRGQLQPLASLWVDRGRAHPPNGVPRLRVLRLSRLGFSCAGSRRSCRARSVRGGPHLSGSPTAPGGRSPR